MMNSRRALLTLPKKNIKSLLLSSNLFSCSVIIVTALLVYSGGFDNDFLSNWDDTVYVTNNTSIQSINLTNIFEILTSFKIGTYAPMQMFSYMFDYSLWGYKYIAFLLVNILLHGINGYIFYRILCRLNLSTGLALLAVVLFIIHPAQVESVVWISQRKNVLAMTFYLAAFSQYLSYVIKREGYRQHYIFSIVFFVFALLTKSVVVIFPLILFCYDFALRQGRERLQSLVLEKIPFLVLALGGALLAVISQGPEYHGGRADGVLWSSGFSTIMTMLTVYKKYLYILFWPFQLSADYQVDIKHSFDLEVLCCIALLGITTLSVFLVAPSMRRLAVFFLAVFFIGFVPVSQIVPFVHLMNDRYLYFPMLGFSVVIVLLLDSCVKIFPFVSRFILYGSIIVLCLLAITSWQRSGVWASSFTLWQDAVNKQPKSALAWDGLGNAYQKIDNYSEAIVNYNKALNINDNYYRTHYNVGICYIEISDFNSAIKHLSKSLNMQSDFSDAMYNLGYSYLMTGQYEAAVETLERGRRQRPDSLKLLVFLGAGYYCLGDLMTARQIYERIPQSDSNSDLNVMAKCMLSLIALRQGDLAESRGLWQEVQMGGLSTADIYANWARMEAIAHHREQALDFIVKAFTAGLNERVTIYDDPSFLSLRNDAEFIQLMRP